MNMLIRELADECWEEDGIGPADFNPEKFAMLIAKECANICDNFQARDVGMQPAECAAAIRKLFGIGE